MRRQGGWAYTNGMTTDAITEASGYCRYSCRLHLSSTARAALEVEWDRVRWA
ncbi:hypothetical protein SUDANB66_06514 (plasmid) [Streptomyces sp. SudanB66_2053]